ncbi:chaperonin 10-like protein [Aspergillus pseudoustus]|uniref:Chaperonin 10-like protein n=1 Tax=Aspergillus pseudoustus TaxID=1810923 RepID=A0ABR4KFX0_9EURO
MSLYIRKPRTPTLAKALIIEAIGKVYILEPYHPVPIPGPGEVPIRCVAVSLNPVDWLSKAYNFGITSLPWINGRDASGVIEAVGEDVADCRVGDVVFTLTDYTKSHAGSYQEFFIATASCVAKIPPRMSFESAAAVPVAAITAAIHGVHPEPLLAKIYGLSVIAIASPENFEYIKLAGADVVLDRNNPDEALHRIREITKGDLRLAFDAVGPRTARLCAKALRSGTQRPPLTLVALAGLPRNVEQDAAFDGISLPTVKVKLFHNEPEYGSSLLKELTAYLTDGRLKPPPISVLAGGFDAVNVGLLQLRNGQISGQKLVVRVNETNNDKLSRPDLGWL